MNLLPALGGGVLGTVLLASALQAATALRMSRIDLPFLLGSMVSGDRDAAKAAGYTLQVAIGLSFAVVYWALMRALETSAWWIGAVFGVLHGLATVTFLIPVLLPAVHRRLGSRWTSAREAPAVARPGDLMRSYGTATPVVTVVGHTLYGLVVAVFAGAG